MPYLKILKRSNLATRDEDLFPRERPKIQLPPTQNYASTSTSTLQLAVGSNTLPISPHEDVATKPIYPEPEPAPTCYQVVPRGRKVAVAILFPLRRKQFIKPAFAQKPTSHFKVVLPGPHNYPNMTLDAEVWRKVIKKWQLEDYLSALPSDPAQYEKIVEHDIKYVEDAARNTSKEDIIALDALEVEKAVEEAKRQELAAWNKAKCKRQTASMP